MTPNEPRPSHADRGELPRDLRRLLSTLASHARTGDLTFDPEQLAILGRELSRRRRAWTGPPARALHEHVRLRTHGLRQAALLRAAAELRMASRPSERLVTAPIGPPPRHAAWSARATRELDRVLREGLPLDGTLLSCALFTPAEWPTATAIALAARALDPGAPSRLCLARARFAAGEHARAEAAYRALLPGCDLVGLRASLHEALGCALERRGAARAACGRFERASQCGAGTRAGLAGLGLALALDDRTGARAFADRLEPALERPFELGHAARELRLRWELAGRHGAWRASALAAPAWSELACESGGLHRALARELFGVAGSLAASVVGGAR